MSKSKDKIIDKNIQLQKIKFNKISEKVISLENELKSLYANKNEITKELTKLYNAKGLS